MVLNIIIIGSNYEIHKNMVKSLLKSKLSIVGKIPSAKIMSKFMNDMTILDFQGIYNSFYFFENMFSILALLINVFQVNLYFLIPGGIGVALLTIFYFLISN